MSHIDAEQSSTTVCCRDDLDSASGDVQHGRPVTPATNWKESVAPDESERFERYAEALRNLQRQAARGGPAARALHAKAPAGLEAEFEVLPDLPEHARVALFATPARYRAYVRFSNGSRLRQADGKGDVRGIAVKVLGVKGRKIIPGLQDATTQDFLLIKSPSTPFRNADEFVGFVTAAESPILLLPRILARFGFRRGLALLRTLAKSVSEPMSSLAATRYYSALAIKYGPYAIHYSLVPQAQVGAGAAALRASGPNYLGDELAERLRSGPVVYDFRVQFFCDEAKTPIEDASVEWKESDAPFVTVARLTLPKQDASSTHGREVAETIERLSFDPWHALEELRPLGDMMRARNHAYRLSVQERKASLEPKDA
jgi:hypothetical protein